MKRTIHIQENAFGYKPSYIRYEASIPTKREVIFLHGAGERGPLDGSNLELVEKIALPKLAKNGFEFPFNINAIQCITSHVAIIKFFPAYIKMKYEAENIIMTGLSLGGFGTFESKLVDDLNLICGIAPICGGLSVNHAANYPKVKAWVAHGKNDTTVSYTRSKGFVDAYNKLHPEDPMNYTLYEGVGHNAWDKAYSTTPGQDDLLQWMIKTFDEAPKPVSDFESLKAKIIDCVNKL